jgi:hypothetical protein
MVDPGPWSRVYYSSVTTGSSTLTIGGVAREAGVPLDRCATTSAGARRAAPADARRLTRLDAKLAELTRMRSALARLATECRGPHLPNECPILAVLDTPVLDTPALEDETDHATR